MSFIFGDGFDLYQQFSDAYAGGTYWDSNANASWTLSSSGRFTGSRGIINGSTTSATVAALTKSSGSNDATHHINVAFQQTTALSGTTSTGWITLYDGSTAQCSIVFRSDGAILLTSGAANGSTLATYASAVAAASTWYQFEFEVVINNTTGSFKVRKNGNTSDDHSTTGLNTRPGANAYANKISIGSASSSFAQYLDDILWRSDSSLTWVGDVRCYTRLPAADGTVQFTRSGSVVPVTPYVQGTTATRTAATPSFQPFTAACSGTLGSVILSLALANSGNMKCTLFTDNSGAPGTIIASATTLTGLALGNNTFTFSSPPSVVQGTKYWLGFQSDTSVSSGWNVSASAFAGAYTNSGATGSGSPTYASFPVSNQAVTASQQCLILTANITPTTAANANLVADPTQDGAGGYVYDSTSGDQDLYTLQAISATPSSVVAVTTRALAQKSDAGTRNIGVQLKSGSTTSNGTSTALNTSFAWTWRTDTVDPDTSAAWTATGVNNLQVGPKVTA